MHTKFLLFTGLLFSILPMQAQYKAFPLSPIPPTGYPTQTPVPSLGGIGGGYAVGTDSAGQFKMKIADSSMTRLNPVPPGPIPGVVTATSTDGIDVFGSLVVLDFDLKLLTCIHWDSSGNPSNIAASSGWMNSSCAGTHGGQNVGFVQNIALYYNQVDVMHACIWTSATSCQDVTSGGLNWAALTATSGNEQVGWQAKDVGSANSTKAYLWHGGPGPVSLHPSSAYNTSAAYATNGLQEGGCASILGVTAQAGGGSHAMLWSGTAASAIDLTPPSSLGLYNTCITAMNATTQLGYGSELATGRRHALLWSGTAASVVDLNQFVPAGYWLTPVGIDADGNIAVNAINYLTGGTQQFSAIVKPYTAPAYKLLSLTVTPSSITQGDSISGVVTLGAPAPAGGQVITLASSNASLLPVPANVTVLEGQTTATFTAVSNGTLSTSLTTVAIIASDPDFNRTANVSVNPIPVLTGLSVSYVDGVQVGFVGGVPTTGMVSVSGIQAGGDVVSLSSGNPSLLGVPATIALQSANSAIFNITSSAVNAPVTVPLTATLGASTLTINVTVVPPPASVLQSLSVPAAVNSGSAFSGYVTINNVAAAAGGVMVTLVSDNPALVPVPASTTVSQGTVIGMFNGTAGSVVGSGTAHVTATYNGVSLTAPVTVTGTVAATIQTAEYDTISKLLKVDATTAVANSTLSYGTDPSLGPLGPMSFSGGLWSAKQSMATAPSVVTVWNSAGGSVTVPITLRAK